MKINFTKADLKTGYIVETRGGKRGTVFLDNCDGNDAIVYMNGVYWTLLNSYNYDLTFHSDSGIDMSNSDIVKVYKPYLLTTCLTQNLKSDRVELVWERPTKTHLKIHLVLEGNDTKVVECDVLGDGNVSDILIERKVVD